MFRKKLDRAHSDLSFCMEENYKSDQSFSFASSACQTEISTVAEMEALQQWDRHRMEDTKMAKEAMEKSFLASCDGKTDHGHRWFFDNSKSKLCEGYKSSIEALNKRIEEREERWGSQQPI